MRSPQLVVVATCLLAAMPCDAQSSRTSLGVNAGTATDVTGVSTSALTVIPSLTAVGANSALSLSAIGTRFSNRSWSGALNGGLSARGTGTVAPAIDLGASAATTSYSFSYFTADALPALELRAGPARLFGGVHLSTAATSGTIQRAPSSPLLGSPTTTRASSTRSASTLVGGATLSTTFESGETAAISYRAETGTVAGGRQTDDVLSGTIGSSSLTIAAAVGRRASTTGPASFGSAGLTIAATRNLAVQLSGGSYPANPMLGTPAGQFVNAGLTVRFDRQPAQLPRPASVRAPQRGMTRLSILAADAQKVEVGGDFNKWQLVATQRATNGVWYVDLAIPPGEYRYAFRVNGKEWRVPAGVAAADDEFGGKSAWLTVTRTASGAGR
jgi:hypothetical protein